jgi:group I intron endonuclease
MSGKVYKVLSPNNKVYIGITNYSLDKRKKEHIRSSLKESSRVYNTKFSKAIRKYGDELKWEIIEDNIICNELLKEKERFYVSFYNSYIDGYNSTPGGDGTGKILSKETREKLSEINRGKSLSSETKQKISDNLKGKMSGEKNPMYGVKYSEDRLSEISDEWVIVKPDDSIEEIINLKKYCRDNNLSQRHLHNVSSGKELHYKNYLCFKKHQFDKEKILEIRKMILLNHPVVVFTDLNNQEYETNNIRSFCKKYALNHSCIISVLKKRREHHKGWKARYK